MTENTITSVIFEKNIKMLISNVKIGEIVKIFYIFFIFNEIGIIGPE